MLTAAHERRAPRRACSRTRPRPSSSAGTRTRSSTRTVGGIRYVNAGSVGMPYEGEPAPTGCCSGPTSSRAARRTTSTRPAHGIAASGMPDAEAFAAEFVASSHARDEAAAFFEAQATGTSAG